MNELCRECTTQSSEVWSNGVPARPTRSWRINLACRHPRSKNCCADSPHPFSVTPTIHWVQGQRGGWWAPCVWCALGVAAIVGGEVRIHTRIGGESEALTIPVIDGEPTGVDGVFVHFAIPPARAWDNVHQHCSMVLPFRSPEEIRAWCERHRLPSGEPVPLPQVARLARLWYGSHGDPDWHKWTVAEAQDIFHEAGLRSDFWDLGAKRGKF
jgi:hypothetical protein